MTTLRQPEPSTWRQALQASSASSSSTSPTFSRTAPASSPASTVGNLLTRPRPRAGVDRSHMNAGVSSSQAPRLELNLDLNDDERLANVDDLDHHDNPDRIADSRQSGAVSSLGHSHHAVGTSATVTAASATTSRVDRNVEASQPSGIRDHSGTRRSDARSGSHPSRSTVSRDAPAPNTSLSSPSIRFNLSSTFSSTSTQPAARTADRTGSSSEASLRGARTLPRLEISPQSLASFKRSFEEATNAGVDEGPVASTSGTSGMSAASARNGAVSLSASASTGRNSSRTDDSSGPQGIPSMPSHRWLPHIRIRGLSSAASRSTSQRSASRVIPSASDSAQSRSTSTRRHTPPSPNLPIRIKRRRPLDGTDETTDSIGSASSSWADATDLPAPTERYSVTIRGQVTSAPPVPEAASSTNVEDADNARFFSTPAPQVVTPLQAYGSTSRLTPSHPISSRSNLTRYLEARMHQDPASSLAASTVTTLYAEGDGTPSDQRPRGAIQDRGGYTVLPTARGRSVLERRSSSSRLDLGSLPHFDFQPLELGMDTPSISEFHDPPAGPVTPYGSSGDEQTVSSGILRRPHLLRNSTAVSPPEESPLHSPEWPYSVSPAGTYDLPDFARSGRDHEALDLTDSDGDIEMYGHVEDDDAVTLASERSLASPAIGSLSSWNPRYMDDDEDMETLDFIDLASNVSDDATEVSAAEEETEEASPNYVAAALPSLDAPSLTEATVSRLASLSAELAHSELSAGSATGRPALRPGRSLATQTSLSSLPSRPEVESWDISSEIRRAEQLRRLIDRRRTIAHEVETLQSRRSAGDLAWYSLSGTSNSATSATPPTLAGQAQSGHVSAMHPATHRRENGGTFETSGTTLSRDHLGFTRRWGSLEAPETSTVRARGNDSARRSFGSEPLGRRPGSLGTGRLRGPTRSHNEAWLRSQGIDFYDPAGSTSFQAGQPDSAAPATRYGSTDARAYGAGYRHASDRDSAASDEAFAHGNEHYPHFLDHGHNRASDTYRRPYSTRIADASVSQHSATMPVTTLDLDTAMAEQDESYSEGRLEEPYVYDDLWHPASGVNSDAHTIRNPDATHNRPENSDYEAMAHLAWQSQGDGAPSIRPQPTDGIVQAVAEVADRYEARADTLERSFESFDRAQRLAEESLATVRRMLGELETGSSSRSSQNYSRSALPGDISATSLPPAETSTQHSISHRQRPPFNPPYRLALPPVDEIYAQVEAEFAGRARVTASDRHRRTGRHGGMQDAINELWDARAALRQAATDAAAGGPSNTASSDSTSHRRALSAEHSEDPWHFPLSFPSSRYSNAIQSPPDPGSSIWPNSPSHPVGPSTSTSGRTRSDLAGSDGHESGSSILDLRTPTFRSLSASLDGIRARAERQHRLTTRLQHAGVGIAADFGNYLSDREIDLSYEALSALSERIGLAKPRGATLESIAGALETYAFTRSSTGLFSSVPNGDSETQDVRCCICLEDYTDGDEMAKSKQCGHALHRQCFETWLQRNATCPVCRKAAV